MSRVIFILGFLFFASSSFAQNKLPVIKQPVFKKDSFYISRYGAKGSAVKWN